MSRLSGTLVTSSWEVPNILDGDETSTDITVPGAALGDFVLVSIARDLQDLQISASVTAANTVTCVISNSTGGAINLVNSTVRVKVIPADVI